MSETGANGTLAEAWWVKDELSAAFNHDLTATCRALHAEQEKHPEKLVDFGIREAPEVPAALARTVQREISGSVTGDL